MKRKLGPMLLFALLIAFTPALALLAGEGPSLAEKGPGSDEQSSKGFYAGGEIIVLDEATGQTLTLTERDYVLGALICEMPALYDPEALKAQAVAIHTYALNVKETQLANPNPELKGAYFKVNSSTYTGYTTEDGAAKIYGKDFAKYYDKMKQAVDETMAQILTYDGKPICACYHAISPGKTEASENIFVTPLPYLVSVDSSFDETAENFLSEARFAPSEVEDYLRSYDSSFTTSGDPANWIDTAVTSEAGTVLSQTICGREYAGTSLREIFRLRSAAFALAYTDGEFVFTVKGYGHGVGLSQYGANYLAETGKTYIEILNHYYPGAVLTQVA